MAAVSKFQDTMPKVTLILGDRARTGHHSLATGTSLSASLSFNFPKSPYSMPQLSYRTDANSSHREALGHNENGFQLCVTPILLSKLAFSPSGSTIDPSI